MERLASVVQEAVAMLTTEPRSGRCHIADVELASLVVAGRVRIIRGTEGKFLIEGTLPEIGPFAIGQGRFPWMLVGGKTLLAGTQNPVANHDVLVTSSRGT